MKISGLLFLAVGVLLACNQPKSADASATANEQLVQQYFQHFNRHDWVGLANLYSETADFKDPSLGQGIVKQTQQQTIAKYTALNGIFPNLHDSITQIYPSGRNYVVVEFISTGKAADGSAFTLPICTILTIENGLITKDFTYYDNFDEQ